MKSCTGGVRLAHPDRADQGQASRGEGAHEVGQLAPPPTGSRASQEEGPWAVGGGRGPVGGAAMDRLAVAVRVIATDHSSRSIIPVILLFLITWFLYI